MFSIVVIDAYIKVQKFSQLLALNFLNVFNKYKYNKTASFYRSGKYFIFYVNLNVIFPKNVKVSKSQHLPGKRKSVKNF